MAVYFSDNSHTILTHMFKHVYYSFYTDEEVKSRSFVKVTSSKSLNDLGAPLPNGLYDAHFGPTESGGTPCISCGCLYTNCTGHSGHLELCVPVYHPLLFSQLVKFLRLKCFACHKFRLAARPLQIFQTKFMLLEQGRVKQMLELEQDLSVASRKARDEASDPRSGPLAVEQALDQVLMERQQQCTQHTSEYEETSLERSLKVSLLKEFVSANVQCKTCHHCGAVSPKVRQDSSNKIFQAPLSESNKRLNRAENVVIQSALVKQDNKRGYDSDDSSRPDETMNDDDDDDLVDSSSDDSEEERDEKQTDQYMHSLEVQAQVQATWNLHPILCASVFGSPTHFFMRNIPIPPARFRPPMILGNMTVEHAQNAHLSKMLISNELIQQYLVDTENPKAEAKSYETMIDLQTTVNCYMDSSKDPSAAASINVQSGIRQILEKKEGIFRK